MLYDYSGCYAKGGEGTTVYPAFLYHHEMPLVPMYDVGKIGFVAQLRPGKFYTYRPQTDTQILQGVVPTVKRGDNSQARRAAVHRIKLSIVGKTHGRV